MYTKNKYFNTSIEHEGINSNTTFTLTTALSPVEWFAISAYTVHVSISAVLTALFRLKSKSFTFEK